MCLIKLILHLHLTDDFFCAPCANCSVQLSWEYATWTQCILSSGASCTQLVSYSVEPQRRQLKRRISSSLWKFPYFRWFEYFILILRADKGHGGRFKQHPLFTETWFLCSSWSAERTGTPTQTLSLTNHREDCWIAAAELNSRLLLTGFCALPLFRLWS